MGQSMRDAGVEKFEQIERSIIQLYLWQTSKNNIIYQWYFLKKKTIKYLITRKIN